MKPVSIVFRIGLIFDEWVKAVESAPKDIRETAKLIESGTLKTFEVLFRNIPNDLITPAGKKELVEAVHVGLEYTQLAEKLTFSTAYSCLLDAFWAEVESGKKSQIFDEEAVEKAFLNELRRKSFPSKNILHSDHLSPNAKATDFSIGPICFQSIDVFSKIYEMHKTTFLAQEEPDWHYAASDCWDYLSSSDHILSIEIEGPSANSPSKGSRVI